MDCHLGEGHVAPVIEKAATLAGLAAYAAAMVGYALVAVIALAPTLVGDLGIDLSPARVEAILLTFQVFLGANVAWLLLFDEVPPGNSLTKG